MNKELTIIGCGISAATLANVLANKGWKITIYEKNGFVGGNCYDSYDKNGILIHNFGPHIFHTSDEEVYKFITQFTKLNGYVNKVMVSVDNKFFPLPINFKSIEVIMGDKAKDVINILKSKFPGKRTITLFDIKQIEEPVVQEFVKYISENVYLNYSVKMWGVKFEDIDPNTINRVKIILSEEHNYFPEDKYQGLPEVSYTDMINKMLKHPNIKVQLNVNGLDLIKITPDKIMFNGQELTTPVVYCGSLDEALRYRLGTLPYRSLNIKFDSFQRGQYQDVAVINYPSDPKLTRITEFKLMTFQKGKEATTISKEYPGAYDPKSKDFNVRYYPIINEKNTKMYEMYANEIKKYKNFYPLGRLAQYKYFDMDDAIKQALELAKQLDK